MISILVAYTKNNRIIGNNGKIPWNLPSERTRFKKICHNKPVIMGRKTFEEIGHSLPYCTIVIISKTLKESPEGCLLAPDLKAGIALCKNYNNSTRTPLKEEEILVAGGGEIYRQVLPHASTIYATEIYAEYEGTAMFPPIDETWIKTEEIPHQEGQITYKYITYKKDQDILF